MIATFDGAPHIAHQLSALQREHVSGGFEVVVADNGSSDETVSIVRSFADSMSVVVVDASEVRGQSFARNAGAQAASGRKLVFLDQDDVIGAGYLERMGAALDAHAVVAARMDTKMLNRAEMDGARGIAQTTELPTDPVPWGYGCTLGVSREAFESVGGFAVDQVGGAEDVDLCWRLHDAGMSVVFVPDAVLHYRLPVTLRELYAQGRRYGRAGVLLFARRGKRDPASSVDTWVKGTLWALLALVRSRRRAERGRALFLLGRRIGQLEGEWQFRNAAR